MNLDDPSSILLVGEGDFSFTRSLVPQLASECNVTATTIASQDENFLAVENLHYLQTLGEHFHNLCNIFFQQEYIN